MAGEMVTEVPYRMIPMVEDEAVVEVVLLAGVSTFD